ncbi:hypothetical protein ACHAW5_001843 [Stephanodiscus triporus]|uniref:Sialate O-acetylesterase domain-containing protein n=1 Tax=Stephanodiscus triporus TaxID=2934178 RepID=A0ABD3MQ18_9STRA
MDSEDLNEHYRSPLLRDEVAPTASHAETKSWSLISSLMNSSLSEFSASSIFDAPSSGARRVGDVEEDPPRDARGRCERIPTMTFIAVFMVVFTVVLFLAAAFMPDTANRAANATAPAPTTPKFPSKPMPLRVYLLAGQSNMEGHASVKTIEYIGDDPETAPLLERIIGPNGKPRDASNVWIAYYTDRDDDRTANGEVFGKLATGYGYRSDPAKDNGMIGPEYAFGLALDRAVSNDIGQQNDRGEGGGGPVLIIKTAWGGKSLDYDFRSPSSGPLPRDKIDAESGGTVANVGHYYRLMIAYAKEVLSDPGRVCPAYDPSVGYEIAGFVWFQGWNDMVDYRYYAGKSGKERDYARYSDMLASFVRDVRTDLGAPDLPFVIGVMGVDGDHANENELLFREAEAAPASLPEFVGNVVAVRTASFWDDRLGAVDKKKAEVADLARRLDDRDPSGPNADGHMTVEDQRRYVADYKSKLISPDEEALLKRGASAPGYHYLGCAKIFAQIGEAFAEAMLQMERAASAQLRKEA